LSQHLKLTLGEERRVKERLTMASESTVTSNSTDGERPKVVVIMGPTASGKSKLAVDLASHFPVEVINADSMQVYRGLDVLSNKLPLSHQNGTTVSLPHLIFLHRNLVPFLKSRFEFAAGVPHHLLGTVSPNVEFTAKAFRDSAIPVCLNRRTKRIHFYFYYFLFAIFFFNFQIIDDILARNRLPVVVGGTNYYIQVGILSHAFFVSCCVICVLHFICLLNGLFLLINFELLPIYPLQALVSPFLLDDSAEDMEESCLGDPPGILLCIWCFLLLYVLSLFQLKYTYHLLHL